MTEPWSFEVCMDCGRNNVVGFTVTDRVWAEVMGESDAPGVFCIFCFDKRAAEKGVEWDKEPVNWWPISTVANAKWGRQQSYSMPEQIERLESDLQALREQLEAYQALADDVHGMIMRNEIGSGPLSHWLTRYAAAHEARKAGRA